MQHTVYTLFIKDRRWDSDWRENHRIKEVFAINKLMLVTKLSFSFLIASIFVLLLSGCASVFQTEDLKKNADDIAQNGGFSKHLVKTKNFQFLTYQKTPNDGFQSAKELHQKNQKISKVNSDLHLYIEGDGRSYLTPTQISPDPTPKNPLALKLAVLDSHPKVVYLARPCQFTKELNPYCEPRLWTKERFSEEIVAAINEAVSEIKAQTKAQRIHLIGFSGGAAVATLIAARRSDIASLRTVAGDLNHERMSEYHHTMPLGECSLNPKNAAAALSLLPQHHFAGEKDLIVPAFISAEFVEAIPKTDLDGVHCVQRTVLKGVSHHEGWEKLWPSLLAMPFTK